MNNINYEQEVKRMYPDAFIDIDTSSIDNDMVCWVTDGNGNRISDLFCDLQPYLWQSAYEMLKGQGKI